MTVPPPNRRTSDVERQLSVMASSRERSNSPLSLLALGGLALLIGIVFLAWSVFGVSRARAEFARQESRAQRWGGYLATIDSLSQSAPDLRELYPIASFMKSDLEDTRDELWANELPQLSIGAHQRRRILPDSPIEQHEIEVTSAQLGVDLERLMMFVNNGLAKQGDKPTFVSQLNLHPMPSSENWRATVKFSNYQVPVDYLKDAQ